MRRTGCVGSGSGCGSGCGRRGQAGTAALPLRRLELEVPRNLGMRAEALAAWVEEVLVGLAGIPASAPNLGLSAPAVDHVARSAAALEVRSKQADPIVTALIVLGKAFCTNLAFRAVHHVLRRFHLDSYIGAATPRVLGGGGGGGVAALLPRGAALASRG